MKYIITAWNVARKLGAFIPALPAMPSIWGALAVALVLSHGATFVGGWKVHKRWEASAELAQLKKDVATRDAIVAERNAQIGHDTIVIADMTQQLKRLRDENAFHDDAVCIASSDQWLRVKSGTISRLPIIGPQPVRALPGTRSPGPRNLRTKAAPLAFTIDGGGRQSGDRRTRYPTRNQGPYGFTDRGGV